MSKIILPASVAFFVLAGPASAHVDPAQHGSLLSGLTHPLMGADHVLAMVAVGLWAAALGGKARFVVPAAFVSVMAFGFAAALLGLSVPMIEPMILASIVALGLCVAFAVRVPVAAAAALAGVFAFFHGAAHGGELGSATALSFGIGFVIATAALHLAGFAVGTLAMQLSSPRILRFAGAAAASAGAYLMVG